MVDLRGLWQLYLRYGTVKVYIIYYSMIYIILILCLQCCTLEMYRYGILLIIQ